MKKVIFLFAMVLATSFAIAQTNDAEINQYGTNIADIEQVGSINEAIINQGAAGASVTNSGSNSGSGWKYGSFITQEGSNNTAEVDVNTSRNGTSIDQLGNYNWAKQKLNANISKTTNWDRMGLDINQEGNNNWANQKTRAGFGTYSVQGMMINQAGDYNIADQMSIGGMNQQVEIEQIGNNNNNTGVSGNIFDVSATGLINPLTLFWAQKPAGDFTQYMFQNKGVAHMYVKGNDNNTYQYQEYVTYGSAEGQGQNDAMMDVWGSGNNVAQDQLGDLNSSDIDIDGDGNVVISSQFGDSNIVNIDLVLGSDNNIVGVQQTGDFNIVSVFQSGDFNIVSVFQSGVSNFAQIIQQ